jgi:hypothetical protein
VVVVPQILGKIMKVPVKPRNVLAHARWIVTAAIDKAGHTIDSIPNAAQRLALMPVGAEMIRIVPNPVVVVAKMPDAIAVVSIVVVVIVPIGLGGGNRRKRRDSERKRQDEDRILHKGCVGIGSHTLRRVSA